ncbi:MAG: ECF-type sigma factor [Acidobacteriota bacterium]
MTRRTAPETRERLAKLEPAPPPSDGRDAVGDSEGRGDVGDVTLLLERWIGGEVEAEEPLIGLVYDELRRLAGRFLSRERADHSLPPTGLVHEAYLRLTRADLRNGVVENRAHFFAAAAQAMRRILVEHARRYQSGRRPAPQRRQSFDDRDDWGAVEPVASEVLAVDEALGRLRATHPRPAKVAELRYFAGLTETEVAEVMGVSRSSVARDWRLARLLLRRSLAPEATGG